MAGFFKKCQCLGKHEGQSRMAVLELQHQGLEDIPSYYLIYDKALEELHLEANSFYELPKFLGYFKNLRLLDMSENELSSVSEVIGELQHLRSLNVSKNNIHEIDEAIQMCTKLELLNVSVNPLIEIPTGFPHLINLTEIYLNEIQLKQLPESFGNLAKLKILELRENNLANLPKSMCMMVVLERLDIGNNHFIELPDVIGTLFALTELWCDINELTMIPSFVGCLKSLVCLDASRNKISDISPDISGCIELTDLHLSFNYLKTIPETFSCLSKLSILKIDSNQLIKLPEKIEEGNAKISPFKDNLSEFILTNNCLSSLPRWVGLLQNLRTLYLDENQLEELPNEIGSCKSLTILSCRSNSLTQIPERIGDLENLKILNLCDNKLLSLPCTLTKLKNLSALWLAKNQTNPLVPLQTEYDTVAKKNVLTCFLLPQKITDDSEELLFDDLNGKNTAPMTASNNNKSRNGHEVKFADKVSTYKGNCNGGKDPKNATLLLPMNDGQGESLKSILSNTNRKAPPELVPTSSAYSLMTQTIYSTVSSNTDMALRSSMPWYARTHCRPSLALNKEAKPKVRLDSIPKITSLVTSSNPLGKSFQLPDGLDNDLHEQCHKCDINDVTFTQRDGPKSSHHFHDPNIQAGAFIRPKEQETFPIHTSNCIIYQLSGSSGYSSDGEIAKMLNGFAIQQGPCCSGNGKNNGLSIMSQGGNGRCLIFPETEGAFCAQHNPFRNIHLERRDLAAHKEKGLALANNVDEIKALKYSLEKPFIPQHVPFTDNETYNSDSSLAIFDHKSLKQRVPMDDALGRSARSSKYNIFRHRKKHSHPAITAILRGYHSDCEKSRLDFMYQAQVDKPTKHHDYKQDGDCYQYVRADDGQPLTQHQSPAQHDGKCEKAKPSSNVKASHHINRKDVPFSWASKYLKIKKQPQDVLMDLNLKSINKSKESTNKDDRNYSHNSQAKFHECPNAVNKTSHGKMTLAKSCQRHDLKLENKLDFVTFLGPTPHDKSLLNNGHKCSRMSHSIAATPTPKYENHKAAKASTKGSNSFYKTKLYNDIEFIPSKLQFNKEDFEGTDSFNFNGKEKCQCSDYSLAQFGNQEPKQADKYISITQRHTSLSPNFPYESFDKLISAHNQSRQRHYSVPNTVSINPHEFAISKVERQVTMPASSNHLKDCDLYCVDGKNHEISCPSGTNDWNSFYNNYPTCTLQESNAKKCEASNHVICSLAQPVQVGHNGGKSKETRTSAESYGANSTMIYEAILYKHNNELGFSIVGGKNRSGDGLTNDCHCHSHHSPYKMVDDGCCKVTQDYPDGISVNKILPNGPAHNILKPRDLILAVNGKDFTTLTHEEAVCILKSTELAVKMKFSRSV